MKSVATVNQWQRCMLVDSRSCRERLLGGLGSTASTWSLGLLLLSMPLLFLLFFFFSIFISARCNEDDDDDACAILAADSLSADATTSR